MLPLPRHQKGDFRKETNDFMLDDNSLLLHLHFEGEHPSLHSSHRQAWSLFCKSIDLYT